MNKMITKKILLIFVIIFLFITPTTIGSFNTSGIDQIEDNIKDINHRSNYFNNLDSFTFFICFIRGKIDNLVKTKDYWFFEANDIFTYDIFFETNGEIFFQREHLQGGHMIMVGSFRFIGFICQSYIFGVFIPRLF